MSAKDLKDMLERLEDTREIVLGPIAAPDDLPFPVDELHFVWRDAEEEAACAYQLWRERPGAEAYAVYVAASDRADAAQHALAASAAEAGLSR
jgi:hypothetical protein